MATKRKRAGVPSPVEGSVEDHLHAVRVMFEEMSNKMTALHEGQKSFEATIRQEFGARFAQLEAKIDALTIAVRINSEDIRKNSEDIKQLRLELERTNALLETKAQASALAALEQRVAAIELRLHSGQN